MVKVAELIRKADGLTVIEARYNITKVLDGDQQLVTGQVYSPGTLDAHGHFMTAEDLRKVAHQFMSDGLHTSIDVQHDNRTIDAVIVETFVARDNDPDFEPGSWVATVKVNDAHVWKLIKDGEINGYSFEILTYRKDVVVEVEFSSWYYGFTDPDPYDKHTHPFMVRMDAKGQIAWGKTGLGSDGSPAHSITKSSITDKVGEHTHRYHMR